MKRVTLPLKMFTNKFLIKNILFDHKLRTINSSQWALGIFTTAHSTYQTLLSTPRLDTAILPGEFYIYI